MAHAPFPFYKTQRKPGTSRSIASSTSSAATPKVTPSRRRSPAAGSRPVRSSQAFYNEDGRASGEAAARRPRAADSVVGVIERFLTWCHEHRKPATYEWYRWRLQMFADHVGKAL